ncbi:MAG: tyrosine-type recombinase/integrase [Saccharofermentanales bacterium]
MRNVTKKIAKDGTVSYLIRVSAGYNIQGKQIKKSKIYKPSANMSEKQIERELEKQVILLEEKVKQGYCVDGNIKFADYAEKFMQTKEMSPKCRERYNDLLKRINIAIGHIRIEKLQPIHLQEFYKDLRSVISKRTKQALTDKTILHHHRLISSVLAQATKEQLIPRNIASRDYMDAPKLTKKEPLFLNDIQARNLVSLLLKEEDIRIKTSIMLLLYSGMRRGELCGLEWKDIDFINNIIEIRRTSQYISGQGIITKDPKNQSSRRALKLPKEILLMLKEYKQWQIQERLKNSYDWHNNINIKVIEGNSFSIKTIKNDRIFTTDDGNQISPDTINFWLEKFREKHNLQAFTPHSLRHTNITLQIASGVSLRTIASRAGHSQTSTTSNIYAHAIQTADELASQALDDILTPKKYGKIL